MNTIKPLFLYITTSCNLRCKHCYVGSNRLNDANHISLQNAEKILQYFKTAFGCNKVFLLGGEPTLHPELDKIIDIALEYGYLVSLTSNGQFESEFFNKISPKKLPTINFSLESPNSETNNKIRGITANFDKVIDNIKEAKKRNYNVGIECAVSEMNYSDMLEFVPFTLKLGISELYLNYIGLTGNAINEVQPVKPEKWIELYEKLQEINTQNNNLSIFYAPAFAKKDKFQEFIRDGYTGCSVRGLEGLHIYPDGNMYLCPVMMDLKHNFGKFDFNLNKIVLNKPEELRLCLEVDDKCLACQFSMECKGGCPAYNNMEAYKKEQWYQCNRDIIPLCILWMTKA